MRLQEEKVILFNLIEEIEATLDNLIDELDWTFENPIENFPEFKRAIAIKSDIVAQLNSILMMDRN